MYIPKQFSAQGDAETYNLVTSHPFATLITDDNGVPFVSHLPLLLESNGHTPGRWIGHMSRKNPHWRLAARSPTTLAVFHGPQAYITPRWYAEHDVPTWNYAVVHVRGQLKLLESPDATIAILKLMTDHFEVGQDAWRFALPEDLKDEEKIAEAIVGFELIPESIQTKIKIGQNRSPADRQGTREGLASRTDDGSRGISALMRRLSV